MVAATLSPTAAQVRSVKSAYVYGATANLRLQTTAAAALVRIGMPSDIPSNATVSSAILTFTQVGDYTGANTISLQRNAAGWAMSKLTWGNKPAQNGVRVDVVKTASLAGTLWAYDMTADVQAFIAGTVPNYGWYLNTTSGTERQLRGSASSVGQPVLVITYLTPGDAPISLSPDGNQAVSVAKPWLTFQVPPDTTAVNVQIDADMIGTPDFDSGDVLAVAGKLDTSATAWAGLTAGGPSLYWRARSKSALGYSAFSSWAQMRRVAKPTVAITSPGATSDDTTPPIVWTATGEVSWQVIITDPLGRIVADSGHIIGTDLTWTPPKAVATEGSTATVEVRVWDAVDRIATTGDLPYAVATQTFTAAGTGAVSPALTITTANDGATPAVTISATRGSAPDSWTVLRDDGAGAIRIATGLSPASANLAPYTDWTADPNKPHTYRAAPYTNGTGTASAGPTSVVTPTCRGIWVIDPANPTVRAVIWGTEEGSWDATELAVIHQPIAGPPVRRVAYRPPLSGAVSGELVDAMGLTADAQIAALYDFKTNDRELRLVLGDRNLLVRIGDLLVNPTPDSDLDRHSGVSFSWWQQGATPWSP